MDNQENKTLNQMNAELATKCYELHYGKKAFATQKGERSRLNGLINRGLMQYFSHPATFFTELEKTDLADATKDKYVQTLSLIARQLAIDEKASLLRNEAAVSNNALLQDYFRNETDQKLADYFDLKVLKPYLDYNINVRNNTYGQVRNATMSKKQQAAYVEYDAFVQKIIESLKNYNLETTIGRFKYQFVVAALILTKGDEIARLDIGMTSLPDGTTATVHKTHLVWNEDEKAILIPSGNKDRKIRRIDLGQDEVLVAAMQTLLELRQKHNSPWLFLKKDGSPPDSNWFGYSFTATMKNIFGKEVSVSIVRHLVSIHISKTSDLKSLESKKALEKRMGHSYKTDMFHYNRTE